MKTTLTTLFFACGLIFGSFQGQAQEFGADDILGIWLNEDKDAHIEVYKEGDIYFGKIIWLKDPNEEDTGLPKLDDENPDEELQKRPIMGLLLLKDFVFDEDEWNDGTIYDPNNGKTYSCYMRMDSMDYLRIRGFIGISLLGRTTYWTRVKE